MHDFFWSAIIRARNFFNIINRTWIAESTWSISFFSVFSEQEFFSEIAQPPFLSQVGVRSLSLVFISDASTTILISPWKRPWRRQSTSKRINFFPFSSACAYAWFCAEASENEMPFRQNTNTGIFTTRCYVWPVKVLDPEYVAPKQFGMFGWFWICLCLRRTSFSLGSSLLLASLVKTRLQPLLVNLLLDDGMNDRKSFCTWLFSPLYRLVQDSRLVV